MVARRKVRYVGEIVAAVAAVDRETASRAAEAIEIAYEPLPRVLSIDEALAPGAPLLHDEQASYVKTIQGGGHGNLVFESSVEEGDVERAFRECDTVVEGIWETQAQHHVYMEPNGCVADVDAAGRITLHATCQSVHHIQQRVAEELGEPMAKVRVRCDTSRRRLRRQACVQHPFNRRVAGARCAPASEAGAFPDPGFRDPTLSSSGAHLDENRRTARRHDHRARRISHARWRRLRGRESRRCWRLRC